ncbi:MAG: response regulator transcription factor [Candidatus Kerfeldbacteria bacterium]|nr:response regulator transcription factor [Candidatus Kerfeldbacteria bacterium]
MRILLIEDEQKIAFALKRGLERDSYAVDVITNGQEGMRRALVATYDLLVLDRLLPGIPDGLDICRAMRTQGRHEPVLVLTARDATHDRVAGLDSGADDYLVKPFSLEELKARIRALLRRPSRTSETILHVGDLELDPGAWEVRRQGRRIELSRKEFALLEYLMRNAGTVVTKDQMIKHVWDFDADILPNTVEAFIASLRGKIDRPFNASPLIHTVRGFGYRLQP